MFTRGRQVNGLRASAQGSQAGCQASPVGTIVLFLLQTLARRGQDAAAGGGREGARSRVGGATGLLNVLSALHVLVESHAPGEPLGSDDARCHGQPSTSV